jgi:hypothetical protein
VCVGWPLLCLCRPFCIFERYLHRTQRAAVANRRAINLATHLPYLATHLLRPGCMHSYIHLILFSVTFAEIRSICMIAVNSIEGPHFELWAPGSQQTDTLTNELHRPSYAVPYCKENPIYVLSEKELRGLIPNFHERLIYSHDRSTYFFAAE